MEHAIGDGALFIVGGGMDGSRERIFRAFLAQAGGREARVAFAVSASGEGPDALFDSYAEELASYGLPRENCILLPLYADGVTDERGQNAGNGDADGLPALLDGVTGVWFTGGDQYYISRCFLRPDGSDTRLLGRLREVLYHGGVIGGSSAGAAIMSRVMIAGGSNRGLLAHGVTLGYDGYAPSLSEDTDPCEALRLTESGLGFFPLGVIDQHFNRRPRLLRSIEACLANTDGRRVAFAVSEDTALICRQGGLAVLGSAGVYVMDCTKAEKTGPGCYRGVVLSVLYEGDTVDSGGEIHLSHTETVSRERSFSRDLVNGALPDGPQFDAALDQLLHGDESDLFRDARGLPCVCGGTVTAAHGTGYLILAAYSKTAAAQGYTRVDGHTAIRSAGLTIHTERFGQIPCLMTDP